MNTEGGSADREDAVAGRRALLTTGAIGGASGGLALLAQTARPRTW